MDTLGGIGVVLFFVTCFTMLVGVVGLIIAGIAANKKMIRVWIYVLLTSALCLLVSLSLCSVGFRANR